MKKSKKGNIVRRKSAARKNPSYLLKIMTIGFILLGLFTLRFLPHNAGQQFQNKYTTNKQITIQKISATPIVYPAATVTPVPTKTIPAGYCLSVPVIYYHHVEPIALATTEGHASLTVDSDRFDSQMKYLNDHGYTTFNAEELVTAVINHTTLPGKAVVVTMDDGYSDVHDYAFPIIKKYNIKTSLFISTGLLGNPGYMNWDNVRDMVGSGLAFAYNHTWSHYSLGRGDAAKIAYEIDTAQSQLEQYFGKKPNIFAYPYGTPSQAAMDVLRKDGFIGAFTTYGSWYQCDSILYSLPRLRIGNASLSSYSL